METTIKILPNQGGRRVEVISANLLQNKTTRSQLKKIGEFFLQTSEGEQKMAGKTKVKVGQTWRVVWVEDAPVDVSVLTPWDYPLEVLTENDNWAVINKPINVSVHPSPSEASQKTVVNALLYHFGKNLAENFIDIEGQSIPRPGIVHRLDKVTSGALLVAKSTKTLRFFQSHWSEFTKTYYTIVTGVPPTKGKISAGIMRDLRDRKKMMVAESERARDALTYFTREAVSDDGKYALLRVTIPTGRTHQIRVHLASIGFAVVGDAVYGGEKAERVFLHAEELNFFDENQQKHLIIAPRPAAFDRFF